MKVENKQLKLFLLDAGLVTSKEIKEAEEKAKKESRELGEVLVSNGKLSEEDLQRLQAYILGIPFVSLAGQKIDFEILSQIPEPIARNYNIIAFKQEGKTLEVAMLDPQNLEAIDFVKKKAGLKILPRLTDQKSLKDALNQYQKSLKAEFSDIINKESESLRVITEGGEGEEDLEKLAEDIPIVRIVDTLLKHAILQRASDIHIEPQEKEVVVRYRIDGMLQDAMILPKNVSQGIIARIKVLASLKLDEKRLPQDGRFKIETDVDKVSFRVSILPVHNGEKAVMRLLRENAKGFSLEFLGFTPRQIDLVHDTVKRPTGMILVTGPTGSGKTTTLYTVLDILNTPEVNISTIEDPVEYQVPIINQSQVKPDIGFTFASGLRSLVRQDPDIIMVGEIRDTETASLAINASLTGHMVLSTLHTNSAAGTIPRMLDMKVEPFLLVSTINIIIAQRLARQLDKNKEQYFLSGAELKNLERLVDINKVMEILKEEKAIDGKINSLSKVPFYRPKPSKDSEGYKSRIGVHEILRVTPTIKELIIANATSDQIAAQAKKEGMITMIEDGILKAVQGITSIEEVLRVTRD